MAKWSLGLRFQGLEYSLYSKHEREKREESSRGANIAELAGMVASRLHVTLDLASHTECSEGGAGSPAPSCPMEVAAVTSAWPCFP